MLAALLPVHVVIAAAADDFEHEPVLAVVELAQPGLLAGPGYTAQAHAPLVGFMARVTLDTPVGAIVADSIELLELRATEMAAIDILDQVAMSEAFTLAAGDSLQDSAKTVAQIVRHPIATVQGLPGGVLRYFRRQSTKWGERLSRHGDRIGQRAGNDGDPYAMLGPMNAGRGLRPPKRKRSWFRSAGREVVRQVEDYVSHSRAKRMLARELGIDPYAASTNPALNARLDRLAWAASAGAMSMGELLGYLPRGGREVLGQSGRLNELVWELEPEELRQRNREVLTRWCGDATQTRRFTRHRAFLASVQTRFVDALDALQPTAGCEDLLDVALGAEHEVEARFLANALVMVENHLGAAVIGSELTTVGAGVLVVLPDGRRVLPLPVDHLSWTQAAGEFFDQPELAEGQRIVLIAGGITDRALRELTTLGWEIVVGAPYPGAPAYAAVDGP